VAGGRPTGDQSSTQPASAKVRSIGTGEIDSLDVFGTILTTRTLYGTSGKSRGSLTSGAESRQWLRKKRRKKKS
jgi:hypothetical protein